MGKFELWTVHVRTPASIGSPSSNDPAIARPANGLRCCIGNCTESQDLAPSTPRRERLNPQAPAHDDFFTTATAHSIAPRA